MLGFLREEFYSSDYQWLIYWSSIGHPECEDCRIGEENRGIPRGLRATAAEWFRLINESIMPLVRGDTLVIVHPDHGSARLGKTIFEQYGDGFMFIRPGSYKGLPPQGTTLHWEHLRAMVKEAAACS
jgi:hypothetical protein